jgi:hypothetical protein
VGSDFHTNGTKDYKGAQSGMGILFHSFLVIVNSAGSKHGGHREPQGGTEFGSRFCITFLHVEAVDSSG